MPSRSTRCLWCYSLILLVLLVALVTVKDDNWLSRKTPVPKPVLQSSHLQTVNGQQAGLRMLEEFVHDEDQGSSHQKGRNLPLNEKQAIMIAHPKPLWGMKSFLQLTKTLEKNENATSNGTTKTPEQATTALDVSQTTPSTPPSPSTDATSSPSDYRAADETVSMTPPTSTAKPQPSNLSKSDTAKLRQEANQSTEAQANGQKQKIEKSSFISTPVYDDFVTVSTTTKNKQQDHGKNATTQHWTKREASRGSERIQASDGKANETFASASNFHNDSSVKSSFQGGLKNAASNSQSNETYLSSRNDARGSNFSTGSRRLILWYQPTNFFPNISFPVPLSACPDARCYVTTNKSFFQDSDALIFAARVAHRVSPPARRPDQIWVLHNHERPLSLTGSRHWFKRKPYKGYFNWTMGYRRDSDIWQPYGLVVPRKTPPNPRNYSAILAAKTGSVAWLVSHCSTDGQREHYVSELQKYVSVDIYGSCGNQKCSRREDTECSAMIEKNYKFYLAFENRLCLDYVTEKFFRFFGSSLVLVVRGGADYTHFAPNGSYINAADFRSARELGAYLSFLSRDDEAYLHYLRAAENWESQFDAYPIFDESGRVKYATYHYLQPPMCDLCQRLWRLQDYRQTLDDVTKWLEKSTCQHARDVGLDREDN